MEPTASVIICTRNRLHDIIACLASLAAQTYVPAEIIVVDSSTVPLTAEPLFAQQFSSVNFPKTMVCYAHTTPGLTYQRNYGIQIARGDILYFFDDDVVLAPSYLTVMQEIFAANPSYAAGMGNISNITKNSAWCYRWFRRLFLLPREQAHGNFTYSGMPTHPYGTTQLRSIEVLGGCCMALRRSIALRYQFDEHMKGYCYLEDADIARRISRDHSIFFAPQALLIHKESPVARDRRTYTSAMFIYNYSYLFFKNFYRYNRVTIVAYGWSVLGLLVQSVLMGDWQQLHGFYKGLSSFYRSKGVDV
jgi:GT2 family glycosyltransferase